PDTGALHFFHWSAAMRVLHSFPTRRSSDLGGGRRAGAVGARGDYQARRSAARRQSALGDGLPRRRPAGRAGVAGERGRAVARPLDRKSTRLNSSHVKISYAVFCLKKKKITK